MDYVDEIVIPAFTETRLPRKHGDTQYHFIDVELENVGSAHQPIVAITGRFVKQTVLRRTQILDPVKGLSRDELAIESAPSAFFILRLDIHRLIYFAETPDAPDIKTFSLAAATSIRAKYNQYIDQEFDRQNSEGGRVTKKALREENPPPTVVAIPLTTKSDVADFISRYSKLQSIHFQLVRPNDEMDGHSMWAALRATDEKLGAETTVVEHRNTNGLNKAEAINEITAASETGNQIIKMNGLDEHGNRLRGNNETYQLSVPLAVVPQDRPGLVKRLVSAFWSLVQAGDIKFDDTGGMKEAEMARLQQRYRL